MNLKQRNIDEISSKFKLLSTKLNDKDIEMLLINMMKNIQIQMEIINIDK